MQKNKLNFTEEELDLIQSVYCPYCHKELEFMSISYLEGFCIDGCEE